MKAQTDDLVCALYKDFTTTRQVTSAAPPEPSRRHRQSSLGSQTMKCPHGITTFRNKATPVALLDKVSEAY